MNDINVMPGIDFRANKEKIRSKKRKEKRINKILNIGINKNMTDSAMESCQELGNTYEYCIAHV